VSGKPQGADSIERRTTKLLATMIGVSVLILAPVAVSFAFVVKGCVEDQERKALSQQCCCDCSR
jgi:hypothetical protein